MDICYFDKSKYCCTILTIKKCDGCTFRKTEKEYNDGAEHAKEILKSKDLIVVEKKIDGVNRISTERLGIEL